MNPSMRFLRRLLFLPIEEAEVREQAVMVTSAEIEHAEREHEAERTRMQSRADDLRKAYDDLLGKME